MQSCLKQTRVRLRDIETKVAVLMSSYKAWLVRHGYIKTQNMVSALGDFRDGKHDDQSDTEFAWSDS